MRMEELANNNYIKSTDTVEQYLLNIVKEYFKDINEAADSSKEWIIQEAVNRLKSEMDYNALGVLSITLPNGETKKGDVTLTLEDLGGEPKIEEKKSAFNVDFGTTTNTACEGNDPRLSDARNPLAHSHEISDVLGLEGAVTSLQGKLQQALNNAHTHSNKNVLDKLEYTGAGNKIDLTIIDTIETKFNQVVQEIRTKIDQYIDDSDETIDKANDDIQEIKNTLNELKMSLKQKFDEAVEQNTNNANQIFDEKKTLLEQELNNKYISRQDAQPMINVAKNAYTFVGRQKIVIKDIIGGITENNPRYNVILDQNLRDKLEARQIDNDKVFDIRFEFSIEYTRNNVRYTIPMPYIDMKTNKQPYAYIYPEVEELTIAGYIKSINMNQSAVNIVFATMPATIDRDIINKGSIICDIYAKEHVNLPF